MGKCFLQCSRRHLQTEIEVGNSKCKIRCSLFKILKLLIVETVTKKKEKIDPKLPLLSRYSQAFTAFLRFLSGKIYPTIWYFPSAAHSPFSLNFLYTSHESLFYMLIERVKRFSKRDASL